MVTGPAVSLSRKYVIYSEQWKKKLSHSILYFPTSFEHRPVFEGGIFKNKKLQKLREKKKNKKYIYIMDSHNPSNEIKTSTFTGN